MDEPFVGLDPKAAHLLKGMMREVCDRGGAIFFSTHVLEVAEKLCDKVAIIKQGKLIRSGTMEEVKGDDSLEEVFENREQIEIAKFYERLPKPTLIAIHEFLNDEIYFRNPRKETQDEF
jgi:ABC-type multidrug transport system ATPase subunit